MIAAIVESLEPGSLLALSCEHHQLIRCGIGTDTYCRLAFTSTGLTHPHGHLKSCGLAHKQNPSVCPVAIPFQTSWC